MVHYLHRSLTVTDLGFNYNFDSLSGKPNELNAAFQEVFNPGANFTIFMFLKNVFPALDIFVSVLASPSKPSR